MGCLNVSGTSSPHFIEFPPASTKEVIDKVDDEVGN